MIFNFLASSKIFKNPFLNFFKKIILLLIFSSSSGKNVKIGRNTKFAYGPFSVLLVSGTTIGDNCIIAPRFSSVRKFPYKAVPHIGDGVFIGPNVVIQGPVTIGNNCIILANSVVTKSFKSGLIVGGVPAKAVGNVEDLDFDILKNPQII